MSARPYSWSVTGVAHTQGDRTWCARFEPPPPLARRSPRVDDPRTVSVIHRGPILVGGQTKHPTTATQHKHKHTAPHRAAAEWHVRSGWARPVAFLVANAVANACRFPSRKVVGLFRAPFVRGPPSSEGPSRPSRRAMTKATVSLYLPTVITWSRDDCNKPYSEHTRTPTRPPPPSSPSSPPPRPCLHSDRHDSHIVSEWHNLSRRRGSMPRAHDLSCRRAFSTLRRSRKPCHTNRARFISAPLPRHRPASRSGHSHSSERRRFAGGRKGRGPAVAQDSTGARQCLSLQNQHCPRRAGWGGEGRASERASQREERGER